MGRSRKESEGNLNRRIGRYVCHFKGLVYQSLMPQTLDPVHNGGCSKVLLKKDIYLPNVFRVNAQIVHFRLYDGWKDAHKNY